MAHQFDILKKQQNKMKKAVILMGILGLGLTSCKEDSTQTQAPSNDVSSFDELTVSPNFDWSTTKTIKINVDGLDGMQVTVSKIMSVEDMNGKVLFKKIVKMNEATTLEFDAPTWVEKVKVKYGDIEKEVEVSGTQGNFDFVPEPDNSDLDPDNI